MLTWIGTHSFALAHAEYEHEGTLAWCCHRRRCYGHVLLAHVTWRPWWWAGRSLLRFKLSQYDILLFPAGSIMKMLSGDAYMYIRYFADHRNCIYGYVPRRWSAMHRLYNDSNAKFSSRRIQLWKSCNAMRTCTPVSTAVIHYMNTSLGECQARIWSQRIIVVLIIMVHLYMSLVHDR